MSATPSNAINWFEIPVRDMDRADRFYGQLLGTPLKRELFGGVPHAIFPSGQGTNVSGALVHEAGREPSDQGAVLYLHTSDLDACLSRLDKLGGKLEKAKTDIGPMGVFAWIRDSEGNVVGLHQPR